MFDFQNPGDTFDSRDLLERIDELVFEQDADDPESFTPEQEAELQALLTFSNEARPYVEDFEHGEAFISEGYFTQYTEDYAKETADNPEKFDAWPFTAIDWDEAADQLKVDYHSFDLNGITYYAR